MKYKEVISKLEQMADPKLVELDIRFGIVTKSRKFGISCPATRKFAKEIGKNHELALRLWKSNIHEAMRIAAFIDEPLLVSEAQLEDWVKDIDNWGTCDTVCGNLFDKTQFAWKKALEWPKRKEEFVRRAGFVMMAALAVHDKQAKDDEFVKFFPLIKKYSTDERNFVKKAVNWALRQIGKRNKRLNKKAINCAKEIYKTNSKSARWIASDALRELKSEAVQKRLNIVS